MLLLGLAASFFVLAGCDDDVAENRPDGPTRIVVSIPPIAWAVEQLAPEGAEITVLLQQGQSEHGTSLTASDTTNLRRADHVFLVGWGLEASAERVLHRKPDWQQVHRLSEVIERSEMEVHTSDSLCGDPTHNHIVHSAIDPHAWLDPVAMAHWVRAVGSALGAEQARIDALVAVCQAIDSEYAEALSGVEYRDIVTHHNAYGWIASRYDLHVAAVIRPNELLETTPGELNAAVEAVRNLDIGAVFIEPQFSGRAAERLRELTGVRLLMLDPLGSGDWPATMRANLASLVDGLSANGAPAVPSGA
jgi:zinc transport system substrate-binding protein